MVSLQAAIAVIALSGAGQTVMLDFYADWCGPCKEMNPTVQSLIAAGYPVQRVNIDKNQALAAKYRVQSIPCFVMLVDGKEVDRAVGPVARGRLERMCKAGAKRKSTELAMLAQDAPPFVPPSPVQPSPVQPASFNATAPSSPFDIAEGARNLSMASQPIAPSPAAPTGVSDATLLAASVRLRVVDPDGQSCGSGTIIDARSGEALIVTCGHIFRDSQGKGQINVDLFGPNPAQKVPGRLISYNLERDVGLVAIRAPGPLTVARVAPSNYRVNRGISVATVGCNNGDAPTVRHSQVNSLDKFLGPPNIQVAGQPVEGRSGGGLFSSDGYLIGVCNAADPSDREGLFAALGSIYAELDRAELAFLYKSPGENLTTAPSAASPANTPRQLSAPAELASLAPLPTSTVETPATLPTHEQAALDEIRQRVKEGAEVIFIIRAKDNPQAQSEVMVVNHASPEFISQLPREASRQERPFHTSLEQPRKTLLEWPAAGQQNGG